MLRIAPPWLSLCTVAVLQQLQQQLAIVEAEHNMYTYIVMFYAV
jgi:hypothetical protein